MADLKFYKGQFVGLFRKGKEVHKGKLNFHAILWEHVTITDVVGCEVQKLDELKAGAYYYSPLLKSRSSKWHNIAGINTTVFIPHDINQRYSGDLMNFLVRDVAINANGLPEIKKVSSDLYQIKGVAYFAVLAPKPVPTTSASQLSGFGQGQNSFGEITMASQNVLLARIFDIFRSNNAIANESAHAQTAIPKKSGGCLSQIVSMILGGIVGLLLYYLWHSNQVQFGILAGLCGLWILAQLLHKQGLRKWAGWGIILFIVLYLYNNKYFIKSELKPQKTEDGSVKVYPPEEDRDNPDPNIKDFLSKKELNWWDFLNKSYQIIYSTSSVNYRKSTMNREASIPKTAQDETQFYSSIYNKLNQFDDKFLDSFIDKIQLKRKKAKLNVPQTAEMVVTMIQEIPYVLVHDQSCQKAVAEAGSGFIKDYHEDKKPCMPNIAAGVQSPYEFAHNLKGDCDTRALLGYTILKRMGIPSSIWMSTAYGHSVLGVGVPAQGNNYKIVDNVKHYAVELTAKGYRLGMISPEQRNMNNWKISNYKN
jgi:hypothetical protein